MCYSLWYNAPTMLPANCLEEEEPPLSDYRPATSWLHYTTSCNTQSSVPEDGRNKRPKPVALIGIIDKPSLLHLFVCLYYPFSTPQRRKLCTTKENLLNLLCSSSLFNWKLLQNMEICVKKLGKFNFIPGGTHSNYRNLQC